MTMHLDPTRTICIDFDGTLIEHYASPYDPAAPLEPVQPGAAPFVDRLIDDGFTVVCLTARPPEQHDQIRSHLYAAGVFVHCVTNVKLPALAYIDDRAIGFWGDWPGSADHLMSRITELASRSCGTGVSPVHDQVCAATIGTPTAARPEPEPGAPDVDHPPTCVPGAPGSPQPPVVPGSAGVSPASS